MSLWTIVCYDCLDFNSSCLSLSASLNFWSSFCCLNSSIFLSFCSWNCLPLSERLRQRLRVIWSRKTSIRCSASISVGVLICNVFSSSSNFCFISKFLNFLSYNKYPLNIFDLSEIFLFSFSIVLISLELQEWKDEFSTSFLLF